MSSFTALNIKLNQKSLKWVKKVIGYDKPQLTDFAGIMKNPTTER